MSKIAAFVNAVKSEAKDAQAVRPAMATATASRSKRRGWPKK
jgi:hypothetical protein